MKTISLIAATMMAGQAMADTVFDDFLGDVGARWDYVADGVMGGVSQGRSEIRAGVMHLTGTVSTANNGGFIQVRQRFSESWPDAAKGLTLNVKGNGQTYYVFLKTPGLSRVWYSYRASFMASDQWQTVQLPFSSFSASHNGMPQSFEPSQVNSIALVAYGADYEADVSFESISLY